MRCRECVKTWVAGGLAPAVRDRCPARNRPGRRGRAIALLGLGVALAALSGSAALAAPATTTVTASEGGTSATLTYRENRGSALGPLYSKLHLTITRAGRPAFDATVSTPFCGTSCWPDVWPGHRFLSVADLGAAGSPDVILDLYSGGAHCCSIVQVYRFEASRGAYSILQRDFGDPGASLVDVGGSRVFLSADDRFAYAFTSFAFSGLPLAIWRLGSHGWVDVTRQFPARIATDAARQYGAYVANRRQGFGLGFIAAWAADEDLLGRAPLVARTLVAAKDDGYLRSADGLAAAGTFIASLQRDLAKWGYAG